MYSFFLVLGCSLAYNIEIRNLPSYNLLDIIYLWNSVKNDGKSIHFI